MSDYKKEDPQKRLARQTKYKEKAGIVSKSYSLDKVVADHFAEVCKAQGVSIGGTLAELMREYIRKYEGK